MDIDLWTKIQDEIKLRVEAEPSLGSFLYSLVLCQKDLIGAVASILASKLHSDALSAMHHNLTTQRDTLLQEKEAALGFV